jgi:hypothetical protein
MVYQQFFLDITILVYICESYTGTINLSIYFGCKTSYEEEKGITLKISKFLPIFEVLNNILKPNSV